MELNKENIIVGTVSESYIQVSDVSDGVWNNEKYQEYINGFDEDFDPNLYGNNILGKFPNLFDLYQNVDYKINSEVLNQLYEKNYTDDDIVTLFKIPEEWALYDRDTNFLKGDILCLVFNAKIEDMYDIKMIEIEELGCNVLLYPRQREEFEKELKENNYSI